MIKSQNYHYINGITYLIIELDEKFIAYEQERYIANGNTLDELLSKLNMREVTSYPMGLL